MHAASLISVARILVLFFLSAFMLISCSSSDSGSRTCTQTEMGELLERVLLLALTMATAVQHVWWRLFPAAVHMLGMQIVDI